MGPILQMSSWRHSCVVQQTWLYVSLIDCFYGWDNCEQSTFHLYVVGNGRRKIFEFAFGSFCLLILWSEAAERSEGTDSRGASRTK